MSINLLSWGKGAFFLIGDCREDKGFFQVSNRSKVSELGLFAPAKLCLNPDWELGVQAIIPCIFHSGGNGVLRGGLCFNPFAGLLIYNFFYHLYSRSGVNICL